MPVTPTFDGHLGVKRPSIASSKNKPFRKYKESLFSKWGYYESRNLTHPAGKAGSSSFAERLTKVCFFSIVADEAP